MQVEIWTDIICPWCGLGNDSLNAALSEFAHGKNVTLVHRSFQLDENAPTAPRPVREMLSQKLKLSDTQIAATTQRIEKLAEAQGIVPYIVLENQVGNTSLAHELAAWATELGKGKAMWDALYRAYFGQARPIFDVDNLVSLAEELGLDGQVARAALTSRSYAERVRAEGREARALGANGVPFIVIDRRYAVPGAQPATVLVEALKEAWDTRIETGLSSLDEGATCSVDGCSEPEQTA